jgi:hypothetical protein
MKVRIIIPGRVDTNHPQELGAPLSYGKKNIAAKKLGFAVMNNHHFSIGKSTISMAIFNSDVLNNQRVDVLILIKRWRKLEFSNP